jgi:uncharacterized membrane protein
VINRNRLLVAASFATALLLGVAVPALAFGGGVGGGGNFGGGGGGGGGGGFGGGGGGFGGGGGIPFPVFFPFFGFGGGSLIPILLFFFLLWLSRSGAARGRGQLGPGPRSNVNLIRLEIGLLSTAQDIPTALHQIVASANTATERGLSQLLQDAALLLLRNQQYWHAASYSYRKVPFLEAETSFNSMTMEARSKLGFETITNLNGSIQQNPQQLPAANGSHSSVPAASLPPGDYIVVVMVVASSAPLKLHPAATSEQVREQLAEIASAAGANLQGVEVIWQPDAANQALTRDDLITMYPELAPI